MRCWCAELQTINLTVLNLLKSHTSLSTCSLNYHIQKRLNIEGYSSGLTF